ncbi:MAG: response regulator [Planctomycetota bacterium]|nr:response regulator [Planctomycetota bacterium]
MADKERNTETILKQLDEITSSTKGRMVLVVDDDVNIRRILVLFLTNVGYKCIEANNGRQALELAAKEHVDLVLLDVMMPVMDGMTVCRSLKSSPETKHIPVILCTAQRTKESVVQALQVNADDYIVKPFRREIVIEKVAKALAKHKAPAQAAVEKERRKSRRKPVVFSFSWSPPKKATQIIYRTRVVNLCNHGVCFELDACDSCAGYCAGTVHEKCWMYPYALTNPESQDIEMILSVAGDGSLQARGRIVHVFRPAGGKTESVGAFFTSVPPETASHLKKLVEA